MLECPISVKDDDCENSYPPFCFKFLKFSTPTVSVIFFLLSQFSVNSYSPETFFLLVITKNDSFCTRHCPISAMVFTVEKIHILEKWHDMNSEPSVQQWGMGKEVRRATLGKERLCRGAARQGNSLFSLRLNPLIMRAV